MPNRIAIALAIVSWFLCSPSRAADKPVILVSCASEPGSIVCLPITPAGTAGAAEKFVGGDEMSGPRGICVAGDFLYVPNQGNQSIGRYNLKAKAAAPTEKHIAASFAVGSDEGSNLVTPIGVVVGPDGALYASDLGNGGSVLRFNLATGQPEPIKGKENNIYAAANDPRGIGFGPDGSLYVCSVNGSGGDDGKSVILRFYGPANAPAGKSPGDPHPAEGQEGAVYAAGLAGPGGLCFGPDGHLYVANFYGNNVLRFAGPASKDKKPGTPLPAEGKDGAIFASEKLTQPNDIAFGPDGLVYVVGNGSGNVVRFFGPAAPKDKKPGEMADEFAPGLVAPLGVAVMRK